MRIVGESGRNKRAINNGKIFEGPTVKKMPRNTGTWTSPCSRYWTTTNPIDSDEQGRRAPLSSAANGASEYFTPADTSTSLLTLSFGRVVPKVKAERDGGWRGRRRRASVERVKFTNSREKKREETTDVVCSGLLPAASILLSFVHSHSSL